ncbi:MAG: hypothetical protein VX589_00475 [Myxococcota bacterium]|nr:hypothetical protein [Myxococcota bacterium]
MSPASAGWTNHGDAAGGAFGFGGQPAFGGMAPSGPLDTEGVQLKINATCGCHVVGNTRPSLVRITDVIDSRAGQANMPYITAGDRTQSYLYHKIAQTHRSVGGRGNWMPPTAIPYSADEVNQIGDWIDSLE